MSHTPPFNPTPMISFSTLGSFFPSFFADVVVAMSSYLFFCLFFAIEFGSVYFSVFSPAIYLSTLLSEAPDEASSWQLNTSFVARRFLVNFPHFSPPNRSFPYFGTVLCSTWLSSGQGLQSFLREVSIFCPLVFPHGISCLGFCPLTTPPPPVLSPLLTAGFSLNRGLSPVMQPFPTFPLLWLCPLALSCSTCTHGLCLAWLIFRNVLLFCLPPGLFFLLCYPPYGWIFKSRCPPGEEVGVMFLTAGIRPLPPLPPHASLFVYEACPLTSRPTLFSLSSRNSSSS